LTILSKSIIYIVCKGQNIW